MHLYFEQLVDKQDMGIFNDTSIPSLLRDFIPFLFIKCLLNLFIQFMSELVKTFIGYKMCRTFLVSLES